jgi:TPR repeat protein
MSFFATYRSSPWNYFALFLILLFLAGCPQSGGMDSTSGHFDRTSSQNAVLNAPEDSYLEVDCLLPGQVRKLGSMTYMSPRRPIKAAAMDCEIRGGEYVAYDRANYDSALTVWMGEAKKGNPVAQTYVGEIYMRSPAAAPRYKLARKWFKKAADKGLKRAQINLGYLYENGLGGNEDIAQAVAWYSKASGADAENILQQYRLSAKQKEDLELLKQDNKNRVSQLKNLKTELENANHTLDATRDELASRTLNLNKQRENMLKQERVIVEAKRELSQINLAEKPALEEKLSKMQVLLLEKEQDLTKKQFEVTALSRQVDDFSVQTRSYQKNLKQLNDRIKNLPGPKIEILDPQLLKTRGLIVAPVDKQAPARLISGKVWAPAGLSKVTVNNEVAEIDGEGSFRKKMFIKGTDTQVVIIAYDRNKRSDKIEFVLSPTTRSIKAENTGVKENKPIAFGNYHALIIGNNKYNHLPKLSTAVYDAQEVSRVMREKYGFQVVTLIDADRKTILSQLNDFRKKLTENDNFLIYYAGHGTLEEKNTIGYWLPVDAALDDSTNWLRTDDVTGIMNLISAKQIIVIADACYSGIMTRAAMTRLESGKSKESYSKWLKKMATYKSRIVISSGETKPVLDGGGGGHSVFAKAFLETLQANSNVLLGIDLHRAIAERVMTASADMGMEQVPQYAGLNRAGHELGDFILVPTP